MGKGTYVYKRLGKGYDYTIRAIVERGLLESEESKGWYKLGLPELSNLKKHPGFIQLTPRDCIQIAQFYKWVDNEFQFQSSNEIIKEFIDKVIAYRYENNIEKITEEELEQLLQDYLSNRQKVECRKRDKNE